MLTLFYILFTDLLQTKRLLGGLILLLPSKLSNQGSVKENGDPEDVDADEFNKITEIEQSLIHSNVPVIIFSLKLAIAFTNLSLLIMKFGDEDTFHFSVHVMQKLIMVVHYIQMHCEWENESKTILNMIIRQSLFAHYM